MHSMKEEKGILSMKIELIEYYHQLTSRCSQEGKYAAFKPIEPFWLCRIFRTE
jgi:hypothetical protein